VSFTALAFASSAWAFYMPHLFATPLSTTPGKPTAMALAHAQAVFDDPTAKDTIYVPLGYQLNLSQAAGMRIGTVSATVVLRNGGNAQVDVTGTVTVDSPANYPPAANRCTPGQSHEAVWRLDVTIAGTPLTVPVYVDRVTAGPEATFASAKLQLCLAGPIGTPAGAQLLNAEFVVRGVFTNPTTIGYHVWRATFTPYVPGTSNPNPAGTIEGQAFVPSSVALTISVKRLKHGIVVIQGRLMAQGRPVSAGYVELYGGRKNVGTKLINRSGRFSFRKRIKRKTVYHAEGVSIGERPGGCIAPSIAPAGCTATMWFSATSRSVAARPRR
jgi:hypothetical protein